MSPFLVCHDYEWHAECIVRYCTYLIYIYIYIYIYYGPGCEGNLTTYILCRGMIYHPEG